MSDNYASFINNMLLYLRKKLNQLKKSDYMSDNYFQRQIIHYDEKKALEHIRFHQDSKNGTGSLFKKELPLEKFFYKIRNEELLLQEEYKYIKSEITESYIFRWDANGYYKSRLVDFIEVIVLQNSKDIITMYPYENRERRRYKDINDEIETNAVQLKRVSQIDKFNKRYGKE